MSEQVLKEFAYSNNSLTTLPQHNLISKIASYFKIPQKQIRASLDLNSLKDDAVIKFNNSDIDHEFCVSAFKLNITDLVNYKQFTKSTFSEMYTIMRSGRGRGDAIFTIYNDGDFFVMYDVKKLDFKGKNVGGIFLNYPDFEDKIVLPLKSFLELVYPLPSQ